MKSTLYVTFTLLFTQCLCKDMVIGTLNVALAGTKFTRDGPSKYLKYSHRTVYDNLEDTATFINNYNIDIVAMQELDVNTNRIPDTPLDDPQEIADFLYENYNKEYLGRFVEARPWGIGEYGNSIIFMEYKFTNPLDNKIQRHKYNSKYPDGETRAAIATKFLWTDANINYQLWVVSTHFSYKALYAQKQLEELMSIVSTFSYPTVICGDFNLDHNNGAYTNYLNNIFNSNGFISIIDPNNIQTYPEDKNENEKKKIDYCLYKDVGNTNWFTVNNAQYIEPVNDRGEYFTDHWGLVFSLCYGNSCGNSINYETLESKHDNTCIDMRIDDQRTVYSYRCHEGNNQKWTYNSKTKQIINAYNGYCLDVSLKAFQDNGAIVLAAKCHNGENQKWDISGDQIKSVNSRCLDARLSNDDIAVYDCHNGDNQKWYF